MRPRLFLFHWNEAECKDLVRAHEAAGWSVDYESSDGARGCKRVVKDPPDAVVVYLTRLPSHGRETAHALRDRKALRTTPIVFVGGEADALVKVRVKVPDGIFTSPGRLPAVLRRLEGAARKPSEG